MPRRPATACWRNSAPICRNMRRSGQRTAPAPGSAAGAATRPGRTMPSGTPRCRQPAPNPACMSARSPPRPGGNRRMILPITLAFADGSGPFAGRVGVGLDLARLQAHYLARTLPPKASFTIMDRDGTLLVQVPDGERVGQRNSREQPLDRQCRSARNIDRAGARRVEPGSRLCPAGRHARAARLMVGLSSQAASRAWPTRSGAACS